MPKLTIEIDYPPNLSAHNADVVVQSPLFRAYVNDELLACIKSLQLSVGPLSNVPTVMVSTTHEDSLEGVSEDLKARLGRYRELLESLGPYVMLAYDGLTPSAPLEPVERRSAWQLIKDGD